MALRGLRTIHWHMTLSTYNTASGHLNQRSDKCGHTLSFFLGIQTRRGNRGNYQSCKNAPPAAGPSLSLVWTEDRRTARKNDLKINHLCGSRLPHYLGILVS